MRPRLLVVPAFALGLAVEVAASVLASTPAYAQSDEDRATARALGQEGQDALDKKDFAKAEDRYRRADKLVHAPTLMLGLARALAGERKYVEAQEAYNRIVREGLPPGAPDAFKKALEDAKTEVDTVAPKIGGVTITVTAAGGADVSAAKVMLDDKPVNAATLGVRRLIDPGAHVLKVTLEGYKPAELKFSVTEGGNATAPITLEKEGAAPPPPPPPPPPPGGGTTTGTPPGGGTTTGTPPGGGTNTAGGGTSVGTGGGEQPQPGKKSILPWVAFGVGGAGLLAGGVTGFLAMSKHSDLAKSCTVNGNQCPPDQQSNVNSYHTMGLISTIGFAVGAVGIGAGAVLLFTQPKGEAAPAPQPAATGALHVVPVLGLGSIGAYGTF